MQPSSGAVAAPRLLGEHVFTAQDQWRFGSASGDVNPMHVDETAARRLIAGRQVVHGVHTLLHLLNAWLQDGGEPTGSELQCRFDRPIGVGDRVVFAAEAPAAGQGPALTASVDGIVCTKLVFAPAAPPRAAWPDDEPVRDVGALAAPLDEPPGSQAAQVLQLAPRLQADWEACFPEAVRALGAPSVAALAGLSYFVGMVCPGLHSVFSSLRVNLGHRAEAGETLRFRVARHDPRLKLFIVEFDGALQGELRAFLRPPPHRQPDTRELLGRVGADEFAGTRALVIGGSRGLGEVTAKLLAAGGAEVLVSYAQGQADAQRVADDIQGAGRGTCRILPLDLQRPLDEQALAALPPLDAVYFYATPRIARRRIEPFDAPLFAEFSAFYLQRFAELCRWLEGRAGGRPVRVYLPSTVFITDRPKGMTEYAMAKAAAEVLAEDLNRAMAQVKVVHSRLPRLATDQTASILGLSVASNVETLLPVVRSVSGRAA